MYVYTQHFPPVCEWSSPFRAFGPPFGSNVVRAVAGVLHLVGAKIRAIGPPPRAGFGLFLIRVYAGIKKPKVLPEPVLATAIMSLPSKAMGQHYEWEANGRGWKKRSSGGLRKKRVK